MLEQHGSTRSTGSTHSTKSNVSSRVESSRDEASQVEFGPLGSSGCWVRQASSVRNFTLFCFPWTLSEDVKKHIFSCCQTHIQVWLRWEEVTLTTAQFIGLNIFKTYNTLTNSGKTFILCWIPGHVEIPGNERADGVAKSALSLPISTVKISVMDFLPRAKLLMRREWQEIWNCCDGSKLHAINPTVGVTKQNDSLSRRDAVIISRLQIGHTRAAHAHLLSDETKQTVRLVILH